jgi:hypothetical protein
VEPEVTAVFPSEALIAAKIGPLTGIVGAYSLVAAVPTARSSGLVGLFGKVGSLNVAVLTNARILKTV